MVIESMVVRFRLLRLFSLFNVFMLTGFDVLPMPVRKTTCPSSRAAARLARTWLRGSVTSLEQGANVKHKNAMCKVVVLPATGISQIS